MLIKHFTFVFAVLIKFASSQTIQVSPVDTRKFQEFVQIISTNGDLMCGGVLIDYEFVATATTCLKNQYPHAIKDGFQDGDKLITGEYKSKDGLALFRFSPSHRGSILQTALEIPTIGQTCVVIEWERDTHDNALVQSLMELNYTQNIFDTILRKRYDTERTCEKPSVKAVICNNQLTSLVVTHCSNESPKYEYIEVYKSNEWIKKVFECAVNNDTQCDSAGHTETNLGNLDIQSTSEPSSTTTTTTRTTETRTTTTQYNTTPRSYREQKKSFGNKANALSGFVLCVLIFMSSLLM